jgi:hypothetical protein
MEESRPPEFAKGAYAGLQRMVTTSRILLRSLREM